MLIIYDGLGITQDNLSRWIFQKLDTFFENGSTEYDIEFDFADKTFSHEINFVELFNTESKGYKWAHSTSNYFSSIADVLIGIKVENDETDVRSTYRLSFILDKATFDSYPNFDSLRCHKLSFSNTVFKKGARFRHIDLDEVLFEPRELSADATFFHREKADIENGILRGDFKGRIGKFQYRHQLEGDGTTFLIGMKFTEQAKFTDCVLDKIQFSFIDEASMSKCFFANSMIEDAKFYNCDFPYQIDHFGYLYKDWFGKSYVKSFILSAGLVALFCWLAQGIQWTTLAFFPIIIFIIPMLYLFLMYSFWYLPNKFFKTNGATHMAVADDIAMIKKQKIEYQEANYRTIREVYRQLRINFEKHGDYQTAGDFYYSQRYCEVINFGGLHNRQFLQTIILSIHYVANGFGERWLRAFVWFWMVLIGFTFIYVPNVDFISTKSTPEYFLNAYDGNDTNTSHTRYKRDDKTSSYDDLNKSNFMLIASTTYQDTNVNYIKDNNRSIAFVEQKDKNKTIFAFDNRFDYQYSEQYIPILHKDIDISFAHSLSKMIAPFISEEKKWFQDRTEKAYYLGFLESILLWIFFLAFVFAVKNRIRR